MKERAAFLGWMREKEISFSEISALKGLSSAEAAPMLEWVESRRPSRQAGLEIIELAAELCLLKKPAPLKIFQKSPGSKELLKKLRILRRPLSLGADERKSLHLKALKLPQNMQAKLTRLYDRRGLSLSFKAFSSQSFSAQVKFLKKIERDLEEGGFWKS